jgi:GT2 family glycosyltransferase
MSQVHQPLTTVVVCAYTLDRLQLTERCLRAVLGQQPAPDQLVVVVDHNEELRARLSASFTTVEVVTSGGPRGLSGARNTGIEVALGDIVVFVDDDAEPAQGWLEAILTGFQGEETLVVGGHAVAAWESGQPAWFPDEYLWVVGCSYRGQRTSGRIRNPIGCNMAFRRAVFETVGGFDSSVGRMGTIPLGAEETELCARLHRSVPGAGIAILEDAVVRHAVPASRGRIGYFIRRCYYEGISKAVLQRLVDGSALAPEGDYVLRTLTGGTAGRLVRALRLDRPATQLRQIAVLWLGLASASIGYVHGRIRSRGLKAGPINQVAARQPADKTGASAT